ncbi:MAG: hypothetical protein SCH98_06445 [Deferrisomatales bacterium]|nr:hypothetical protein [Deferrisomatales bacterium]
MRSVSSKAATAALLLTGFFAGSALAGEAEDAASAAYGQVHSAYGQKDAFRQSATLPLTSDGTPMETLDGETSFPAQLRAPSSDAYLTVLAQPGGTGDLQVVRIGQDTDLDGTPDYAFTVPFRVSGVCANGVIGCEPGTWSNCRFHEWVADASGRVSLREVPASSLGGCYCINDDCGSNLVWTNLALVLRDLGGGAVGAAQAARPDFSVSEVRVDPPTVTYYGQKVGAAAPGPATAVTQQRYYRDALGLEADARAELLAQGGDPGSLYSLTLGAMTRAGTGASRSTCTVERSVTLEEVTLADILEDRGGTEGSFTPSIDPVTGQPYVRWVLGRYTSSSWMPNNSIVDQIREVYIARPERITRAVLTEVRSDDTTLVVLGGTVVYGQPWMCGYDGTGCSLSAGNLLTYPDLDLTAHFRSPGLLEGNARVFVGRNGEGYAVIRIEVEESCEPREAVANGCAGFEADPACTLGGETVDGVVTVRNGTPTGLVPLGETRTITGGNCVLDVTPAWWRKERSYLCADAAAFDFADAKERLGAIDASVAFGAGTLTYTDRRRDASGAWVVEDGAIEVGLTPAPGECERACKTRRRRENTQVGSTGHVADQRLGTEGYDFFYKSCGPDDTCPREAGEELLIPCRCIDEFAEAATVLLSLRAAQEDLICSDGTRK